MYAIIECGNHQFKVEPDTLIEVNRLDLEEGAQYLTDKVLLVDQGEGKVAVGAPYVANSKVTARVVEHYRGKKIVVFKMKRRKNYKRTRGHRSELTRLVIESIESQGAKAVSDGKRKAAPVPRKKSAEGDKLKAEKKAADSPKPKKTARKA
ncbi:MAG: 50S ribosomal protein L21 [Deltaproteobacteria bacterium]|nr:50S ribosomal protein L21 [Deltaproteobacteria bacterium]